MAFTRRIPMQDAMAGAGALLSPEQVLSLTVAIVESRAGQMLEAITANGSIRGTANRRDRIGKTA
jgi:hypothetical protein